MEEDKDLGVLKNQQVVVQQDEERILKMSHSSVDSMHFSRDKRYTRRYDLLTFKLMWYMLLSLSEL